jgi:hypothetical protein
MPTAIHTPELAAAVQCYFDILHECDLDKFDRLFHPACHLFAVVDGVEQVLSLSAYRDVLAKRASPKSTGQPREVSVIASFVLSESIAMVRVRVRLGDKVYQDHLNFVRTEGNWKLVAKLYVLEAPDDEAGTALR